MNKYYIVYTENVRNYVDVLTPKEQDALQVFCFSKKPEMALDHYVYGAGVSLAKNHMMDIVSQLDKHSVPVTLIFDEFNGFTCVDQEGYVLFYIPLMGLLENLANFGSVYRKPFLKAFTEVFNMLLGRATLEENTICLDESKAPHHYNVMKWAFVLKD